MSNRATESVGPPHYFKGEVMAWTQCDVGGCNAQSYVTTTLDTGKVLDWCGHHFYERDEALWPYVVSVDDRRAELLEKVSSSANV